MKTRIFIIAALCIAVSAIAQTQDMDSALTTLAANIATQIADHGNKKVTVLDFTDLQNNSSELGRYVAEQMTVDLVMAKRNFSVLDRANLKSILAEHKLTATGLVDPDTAKKLGQFAGVDAIIIGNIAPVGSNVKLTVKIITTDTAEIVGAAKTQFTSDDTVQKLLDTPAAGGSAGGDSPSDLNDDKAQVTKTFGDLAIQLGSLKIVNGRDYLLTMNLVNRSPTNTVWLGLLKGERNIAAAMLYDSDGTKFYGDTTGGIDYVPVFGYGDPGATFRPSTEIKPRESATATITFSGTAYARPSPGVCNVEIDFVMGNRKIIGNGWSGNPPMPEAAETPTLTAKVKAD